MHRVESRAAGNKSVLSHRSLFLDSRAGSGVFSASSGRSSVAELRKELAAEENVKTRIKDISKLLVVVAPPLLALVAISFLTIDQASETMSEAKHLMKQIDTAQKTTTVAKFLQRERGMSCVFLSSSNNSSNVEEKLAEFRTGTNAVVEDLATEPDLTSVARKLENSLKNHRRLVSARFVACPENLRWYTRQVDKLIGSIHDSLRKTSLGTTWEIVGSYVSMLKAIDLVGIQRAMGGAYFAAGGFDETSFASYFEIAGGSKFMLAGSFLGYPAAEKHFEELKGENEQLMFKIKGLQDKIIHKDVDGADPELGLDWFEQLTRYIALLQSTEQMTSEVVLRQVRSKFDKTARNYYLAISIVVVSMIISPVAVFYYGFQSQKMMKKIRKFTKSLSSKTSELNSEKQKTGNDILLHQMLPASIVKSLKKNREVEPEQFESVTLFFSDILGFTNLASRCSPMEVVELLNRLYMQCDEILDQYDVYKVETIGDAYMVASGLPKRNGDNHGNEIATLALDVLQMMDCFLIPYMNGETLLMRIGLHSGPCAAGIVGSKMPRYCLFGDTVNTASRMESTGKAMRIQISDASKNLLATNFPGQFQIKERGKVPIKGKGTMTTHWLLGKSDFPYSIDTGKAEMRVQRSTYWKIIEPNQDDNFVDEFAELQL